MSGAGDSEKADEVIRLVSVNADKLLSTSPAARSILGGVEGSMQKPAPDVCARSSNYSSVVHSSVCSSSAVTSMSLGNKKSNAYLPVTCRSETAASFESSTNSVSVAQVTQENRLHDNSVSDTSLSSRLASISDSSVSNGAVQTDNTSTSLAAGISDSTVTKPTTTMHVLPSAVSNHSHCKTAPLVEDSDQQELLGNNFHLSKGDAVSQTCYFFDSKTNVIVSNDVCEPCDGLLSLPAEYQVCIGAGISDKPENVEPSSSDQLQKIAVSAKTDDWPAESSGAEMNIDVEHTEESKEHDVTVQSNGVLRIDTGKSVSRKPSRIVSFTTEDFDLFQSKSAAVCDLSVTCLKVLFG